MELHGTVVNGVLVFDGPPPPDGTRLRAEPAAGADDVWDESDPGPPPAEETYEEYLQSLRDSVAAAEAGEKGLSVEETFAQIRRALDHKATLKGKG